MNADWVGRIPEGNVSGDDFVGTIVGFDKKEGFRGFWYWLILDKLKNYNGDRRSLSYRMSDDEAILYIAFLSQWNRANHQITELDYHRFKKYMIDHNKEFNLWEAERLETLELEGERMVILRLFRGLQEIKGIEWVGASKILHMRLPKLFIPIDTLIAKEYKIKNNEKNASKYFEFLRIMKEKFGEEPLDIYESDPEKVKGGHKNKTFAKAIDEYNYCKVHQGDFEVK